MESGVGEGKGCGDIGGIKIKKNSEQRRVATSASIGITYLIEDWKLEIWF